MIHTEEEEEANDPDHGEVDHGCEDSLVEGESDHLENPPEEVGTPFSPGLEQSPDYEGETGNANDSPSPANTQSDPAQALLQPSSQNAVPEFSPQATTPTSSMGSGAVPCTQPGGEAPAAGGEAEHPSRDIPDLRQQFLHNQMLPLPGQVWKQYSYPFSCEIRNENTLSLCYSTLSPYIV